MTHWIADLEHSEIRFKVAHLNIVYTTGKFGKFQVLLHKSTDFEEAEFTVELQADSIHTLNAIRDERLCSEDFFDVKNFPLVTFTSTHWTAVADQEYSLEGDLSLLAETKSVKLKAVVNGQAMDPYSGEEKLGMTVTGVIDRRDFGMTFNLPLKAGGWAVGNKIELTAELEFKPVDTE